MRGRAKAWRAVLAMALALGSGGTPPAGASDYGLRGAIESGPPAGPAPALVRRGTDVFVRGAREAAAPLPEGNVTLNLVNAPVAVAARAVLVDALGWSYSLDERVAGTVTLQTAGPVSRAALLGLFESALAARGVTLRRRGSHVQILPAGAPPPPSGVRGTPDAAGEPGAQVIPLRWISAGEMQSILAAVAPRDLVLRADRTRNLLIVSGDRAQIQALRETIAVFDVDWMRVLRIQENASQGEVPRPADDEFGFLLGNLHIRAARHVPAPDLDAGTGQFLMKLRKVRMPEIGIDPPSIAHPDPDGGEMRVGATLHEWIHASTRSHDVHQAHDVHRSAFEPAHRKSPSFRGYQRGLSETDFTVLPEIYGDLTTDYILARTVSSHSAIFHTCAN
ncbi:secretin N-terminal domain-containing protein [Methylobacterium sp. WSM2598]|uniref:secretin N-terminal domain-containing protein n=1 Tax=Methylobacterium sp. WSM2598 TaxID=398261 RepID=UPI00035E7ACB|nr:secretin N-terminal domain-containing protein [Methylobacterium sp. WSM2598]